MSYSENLPPIQFSPAQLEQLGLRCISYLTTRCALSASEYEDIVTCGNNEDYEGLANYINTLVLIANDNDVYRTDLAYASEIVECLAEHFEYYDDVA